MPVRGTGARLAHGVRTVPASGTYSASRAADAWLLTETDWRLEGVFEQPRGRPTPAWEGFARRDVTARAFRVPYGPSPSASNSTPQRADIARDVAVPMRLAVNSMVRRSAPWRCVLTRPTFWPLPRGYRRRRRASSQRQVRFDGR